MDRSRDLSLTRWDGTDLCLPGGVCNDSHCHVRRLLGSVASRAPRGSSPPVVGLLPPPANLTMRQEASHSSLLRLVSLLLPLFCAAAAAWGCDAEGREGCCVGANTILWAGSLPGGLAGCGEACRQTDGCAFIVHGWRTAGDGPYPSNTGSRQIAGSGPATSSANASDVATRAAWCVLHSRCYTNTPPRDVAAAACAVGAAQAGHGRGGSRHVRSGAPAGLLVPASRHRPRPQNKHAQPSPHAPPAGPLRAAVAQLANRWRWPRPGAAEQARRPHPRLRPARRTRPRWGRGGQQRGARAAAAASAAAAAAEGVGPGGGGVPALVAQHGAADARGVALHRGQPRRHARPARPPCPPYPARRPLCRSASVPVALLPSSLAGRSLAPPSSRPSSWPSSRHLPGPPPDPPPWPSSPRPRALLDGLRQRQALRIGGVRLAARQPPRGLVRHVQIRGRPPRHWPVRVRASAHLCASASVSARARPRAGAPIRLTSV